MTSLCFSSSPFPNQIYVLIAVVSAALASLLQFPWLMMLWQKRQAVEFLFLVPKASSSSWHQMCKNVWNEKKDLKMNEWKLVDDEL